jgi:hypothetical protein
MQPLGIGRGPAAGRRDLHAALAAVALLTLGLDYWSAHAAGAADERGAVTNWASEVITETASARGRDTVEANRVTLTVAGGPVVVQWSLSYDAYFSTTLQGLGQDVSVVRVQTLASLERDGVEIARWKLADQTQNLSLSDRAGSGQWDRKRPVRRPGVGHRAQDLRPEGIE